MKDDEKPLRQKAAEARTEKWFGDEDRHAAQDPKTGPEAKPPVDALPSSITPPDGRRYEFPIPSMAIFDLLGIQLAECTRIARTLADDVVVKPFTTSELPQIVEAFQHVVTSSSVIADTMDLVQNGRPRLPAPQRSGRS